MSQIINEGRRFEIYCKTKLNVLYKFLGKHTGRANTVNLPKLEISKFSGDPTKWQPFFHSFQAAVGKSTNLAGVEKFN